MLDYNTLLKEIRGVMAHKNLITLNEEDVVATIPDEKVIVLPKFRISDQWGQPGSQDRRVAEMFLSNIQGDTLEAKVDSIEEFIRGCDDACKSAKDIPEILGNLVFLDVLSSIIYDFNSKTAGFLWESLLAALIGGKQIGSDQGRNTPIEDLLDADDQPLSVKLVADDSKYITGSTAGLEKALKSYGQITYLVVTKDSAKGMSLSFYRFVVTPENYSSLMDRHTNTQWRIPYDKFKSDKNKIATLSLGTPDSLKAIAAQYTERLGEGVTEIFNSLDALTKNVTQYYANAPDGKSAAVDAKTDAENLKRTVDREVVA